MIGLQLLPTFLFWINLLVILRLKSYAALNKRQTMILIGVSIEEKREVRAQDHQQIIQKYVLLELKHVTEGINDKQICVFCFRKRKMAYTYTLNHLPLDEFVMLRN